MQRRLSKLKTLQEGLYTIIDKIFNNPFKEIGVSWLQLRRLKYFPKKDVQVHILFGKKTFFYGRVEYLYGLKEIFIDELYLQKLPPNANVIDCGAHIGLSVLYLKRLCP